MNAICKLQTGNGTCLNHVSFDEMLACSTVYIFALCFDSLISVLFEVAQGVSSLLTIVYLVPLVRLSFLGKKQLLLMKKRPTEADLPDPEQNCE